MSILELKNETLKSETYQHIKDIKDIFLMVNDNALEDNKLIDDYSSFIKHKSDIYLFNVNEFGTSWPSRSIVGPVTDTNLMKHLDQSKDYVNKYYRWSNVWFILF